MTSESLVISRDSNPKLICTVSSTFHSSYTHRGFTTHVLNSVLFGKNMSFTFMLLVPLTVSVCSSSALHSTQTVLQDACPYAPPLLKAEIPLRVSAVALFWEPVIPTPWFSVLLDSHCLRQLNGFESAGISGLLY